MSRSDDSHCATQYSSFDMPCWIFESDDNETTQTQEFSKSTMPIHTVDTTAPGRASNSSDLRGGTRSGAPSLFSSTESEPTTNQAVEVILRRRAQNRASQQAFRQRKEKHAQGLKRQLGILTTKHLELQTSYTQQTQKMKQLHARLDQINAELSTVRSTQEKRIVSLQQQTFDWNEFASFDAFTSSPDYVSSQANSQPMMTIPVLARDPLLPQMEEQMDLRQYEI